jgi:hypothetical protein
MHRPVPDFLQVAGRSGQFRAAVPDPGHSPPELSDPVGTLVPMIRETVLDTATDDDANSGLLRLHLAGDAARLTWTPNPPPDVVPPPSYSFQVSARSLLLALRAAWGDTHPGSTELDVTIAPKRRERPGPPNSRQPWSVDLDAVLRDTWLAATSATPADEVIGELAKQMGRSRGGIRARLARTGCDPDVPGRTLVEDGAEPEGGAVGQPD